MSKIDFWLLFSELVPLNKLDSGESLWCIVHITTIIARFISVLFTVRSSTLGILRANQPVKVTTTRARAFSFSLDSTTLKLSKLSTTNDVSSQAFNGTLPLG